jgi:hypothetical protein
MVTHPVLVGAVVALALTGCKAAGSGTIRGVRYRIALPGSYSLVERDDREHVWVPSDDDRPIVSIHLSPRAQVVGQGPQACGGGDGSVGTSEGGLIFVRQGNSVDLKMTGAPDGAAVHVSRCVPPGEEGLSCMANYTDGKLPPDRKNAAAVICESLTLR